MSEQDRYDRQIRFFGADGQRRIGTASVVMMGVGGLGIHVIQSLAYLGVRRWTVIEHDDLDDTSMNRFITAVPGEEGKAKLQKAVELISAVQPGAEIDPIDGFLGDPDSEARIVAAVAAADLVIGCFDKEWPRLIATRLCSEAGVTYIDAGTDIVPSEDGVVYGGRVVVAGDGNGCLMCLGEIDLDELRREQMTKTQRREHDAIYGIDREALDGPGPSVVTINAVVASLAATEAMVILTGLREPNHKLTYRGDLGGVTRGRDPGNPDCSFCAHWRETPEATTEETA